MTTSDPTPASISAEIQQPPKSGRVIAAAGVGNALEWYDFATYSFLTPVIAKIFFPVFDPIAAIIATFAVFAVGFGMRPVGALVFGHTADRIGRKWSLVVLVIMMGGSTLLIGLMPPYASVGILAPLLLMLARLLQGLAIGGEFGTSTSFLVEHAKRNRRGLIGSIAYVTIYVGNFVGGATVLVTKTVIGSEGVAEWGWRIPFLLSLPLLLLGLYLRLRVEETPTFQSARAKTQGTKAPALEALRAHWRPMLTVLGINACFSAVAYLMLSFMQSYLSSVLHYPGNLALVTVLIAIVLGGILTPMFGHLSDRVGRKSILLVACCGTVLLTFPGFALLEQQSATLSVLGQFLIWIPVAAFSGALPAALAEMFPTNVRVSAFGIAYALSAAIFGGTTPFVATLLVRSTGSTVSPAWYLASLGVVSLAFVMTTHETARKDL